MQFFPIINYIGITNNKYNSQAMDEYSELTSSYIQQKYRLPKIAVKKLDEANHFINDPSAALKLILAKNARKSEEEANPLATVNSSRVNGHMKRSATLELEDLSPERELISQKMKKYKPANGSFSQHYAEQLSIGSSRNKRPNGLSTIPELDISKFLNKQKPKRTRKPNLSSLQLQKLKPLVSHRSESSYLQKLIEIRENSDLLRENSRHLLKKADSVVVINENSYEKLQDDSKRIISGQEKYVLDLELRETERKGHIRWKSRR